MLIARDRLAAHPGRTRAATVAAAVAVVAVGLRTPISLVIAGLLLWLVGLTHGLAIRPSNDPPEPVTIARRVGHHHESGQDGHLRPVRCDACDQETPPDDERP